MSFRSSDEFDQEGRDLYNQGDFEGALKAFQEGLRRFPGDPDLTLGTGMAHVRQGDYVQACELLEGLRRRAGPWGDALQGLAEAYLWLGKKEKALECIKEASGPQEKDASFVNGLAVILYEHDQFEDAARYHRKAAAVDPDYAPAHMGYAVCCHRLHRPQDAVAALKRAIGANPDYWEAYSYLGNILYDLNQHKDAKSILEKIPIEELWDPTSLRRLLRLLRGRGDTRRRKALAERLAEIQRARQESGIGTFLQELGARLERQASQESRKSGERFWTGKPPAAPAVGLRLDDILGRLFTAPCNMADGRRPRWIRFDRTLCDRYLALLVRFLDELNGTFKTSGGGAEAVEKSGVASLLFYGADIILEMRRKTKGGLERAATTRLRDALKRLSPHLPPRSPARKPFNRLTVALR